MDSPDTIGREEAERVLDELAFVNRWMGGTSACRSQVAPALQRLARDGKSQDCVILDLGAGGADLAIEMARWAGDAGLRARIVAIDFNHTICRIAADRAALHPEIQLVCADVRRLPLRPASCDLVVCSAFLHHFTDDEIVSLLRQLSLVSRGPLVVNDLQRSLPAWLGIYAVTRLLSWSAMAKNDGPLSVRKGFRRRELMRLSERAGLRLDGLRLRWAFRYALTLRRPAAEPRRETA